jgi:voltage-gated potassium channel
MTDDNPRTSDSTPARTERLRWRTLRRLERRLATPMAFLGLAWLGLFAFDMTVGVNPLLTGLSTAIWLLFILDFIVRLTLAPNRLAYVRGNWLTALSLLVPALRIGRLFVAARTLRAVSAARGLRLVRAVTSLNRGMGALGATMRRRGVAYVVVLTIAVTLAGAAGMYALEPRAGAGSGFSNFGDSLWWTGMIMTTMGSAYWPLTPEGRILAFLLSLFAIGVFGYITATLASFFIDRDAATPGAAVADSAELRAIRRDIAALAAASKTALEASRAERRESSTPDDEESA